MRPTTTPNLTRGRVYRTADLARWSANPTRLAERLVQEGRLERLAQGMFYAPRQTRFGPSPPTTEAVLRALLRGDDYLVTGPERWNALGLGTTSVQPGRLVYNRKRTGDFELGGQRLQLRRVAFPGHPGSEWFVVDLLENLPLAGADASAVERNLTRALSEGRFDVQALRNAAAHFGTQRTRDVVQRAVQHSRAA